MFLAPRPPRPSETRTRHTTMKQQDQGLPRDIEARARSLSPASCFGGGQPACSPSSPLSLPPPLPWRIIHYVSPPPHALQMLHIVIRARDSRLELPAPSDLQGGLLAGRAALLARLFSRRTRADLSNCRLPLFLAPVHTCTHTYQTYTYKLFVFVCGGHSHIIWGVRS